MMASVTRTVLAAVACSLVAACAPSVMTTEPPATWMMKRARDLPDPKGDDDAKALYADARKRYGDLKGQVDGLQAHVRARQGQP